MELVEQDLKAEMEKTLVSKDKNQNDTLSADSISQEKFQLERESSENFKLNDLEEKKRELVSFSCLLIDPK